MKKSLGFVFLLLILFSTPSLAATYYASPAGGGAASCVDNTTNVCSLQRAITVAAGGTNTIELANGSYTCSTSCNFNATNTGAVLTLQKATGATVTVGTSGASYVFDIQSAMISGTITFDGVGISTSTADYGIRNKAPEVHVVYKNGSISETDATQGVPFRWEVDTTNNISLVSGEDTVTNLKTGATTNVKIAQKIVVGASGITVNRTAIKMRRRCGNIGTDCNTFVSGESWDYRNAETLTLTIETDNAGAPSGTPVTNGTATTVRAFDVRPLRAEWQSFSFSSNVSLTASTTYWVVLTGSYTASASNYIEVSTDTGNGYASGDSSTYNGTTWTAAAAGTDLLFTIDRAHARDLTVQDSTLSSRASSASIGWSRDVIFSRNTMTSTAGGGPSIAPALQDTKADIHVNRFIVEDNVVDFQTSLSQMVVFGTNSLVFTYTNVVIVKGNTGTVNVISSPRDYVHKLFIYGNNLNITQGSNSIFLGKEVDGVDPQEIPYNPFDQVVIENNTLTWDTPTVNHMALLGIGTENGVLINNTFIAPANSGAGSGGWGIVVKAARWTIMGNKFYGAGPGVYLTSNHNRVLYNTFESWDASGSNAAILFRNHQDNVYGGSHGLPKYNFVENNIFISNGTWSALTHCDTTLCNTIPSTLGPGRTSPYWSNRIDNNVYYGRNATNHVQIGNGVNLENVTLAEGITVARAAWASSTYTDSDSISQYNDISANSVIAEPAGVNGILGIFATSSGYVIGKGTISGSSIGAYQLSGSLASGPFGALPFGG